MFIYYLISLLLGLLLAGISIFIGRQILFASTILHGPVFVPSTDDKLKLMLKLAKPKQGEKIIDLGSGDGKILIALAKLGYRVEGVEINPLLVSQSRKKINRLGLEKLIKVRRMNFWKIDFSEYDLVFLYGTTYIMKKLEKKLLAELNPNARIVSNYFQFPNWKPEKMENDVRVYRR